MTDFDQSINCHISLNAPKRNIKCERSAIPFLLNYDGQEMREERQERRASAICNQLFSFRTWGFLNGENGFKNGAFPHPKNKDCFFFNFRNYLANRRSTYLSEVLVQSISYCGSSWKFSQYSYERIHLFTQSGVYGFCILCCMDCYILIFDVLHFLEEKGNIIKKNLQVFSLVFFFFINTL